MDGAGAVDRLEGAVEDGEVLGLELRRAFDRLALVDVGDDRVHLGGRVSELAQGGRHGLVDDLEEALAHELLVLDEGDVRLDAGGVAIHHERDGSGGGEQRGLRVADAVGLGEDQGLVPDVAGGAVEVGREAVLLRDAVRRRRDASR